MGKTKERAWRGMDERKRELRYTNERKRKIKQAHKLLDDDDDDVVILDPKRKRRELVEKVSSSSDISLDDDDDDDDDDDGGGGGRGRGGDDDDKDDEDVELLDPKHKQCELIDDDDDDDDDDGDGDGNDDDDDDVELLDPKHKQCELIDDDGGNGGGGGDDDDDHDDDDGVELLDSKQKQCELDDGGGGDVELLELKQEHHDSFENVSPMSNSHSFFQSGTVYVRGYKVKQSIATLLEAIFKKHGDIAANCVFKASSTRIHFLEVVCEIVQRIQINGLTEMVKDNIESKLSDAEAANINVSWIRANIEAFHKRKESGKKYSLLMEMKSNTMLVKAAAQTDLRERCEELMDAQERFEKAEKCVRVLHLVEKNINDNILKSKAEIDSLVAHPVV